MAQVGGRCLLECGRKVATHSKTNICSTCLGNLAGWRRKTPAARLRYRDILNLRQRRQEEIDKFPKGYRLGRFEPKKRRGNDDDDDQ